MKSVLISIQPYWVFLIIAKAMGWNINKEKTIEIRKNFPKDKNWNKVVKIYCSKDKNSFNIIPKEYQPLMERFLGKVIGEFVCDYILGHCEMANADIAEQRGCIKREELYKYAGNKELYGWHISNLVIYDKPKELGEFYKPCIDEEYQYCPCCKYGCEIFSPDEVECSADIAGACYEQICLNKVKKPPQSWCYVEEVETK